MLRYFVVILIILMTGCSSARSSVPIKPGDVKGNIIFISNRNNKLQQLYSIRLDGSTPRLIITNTSYNDTPVLTADEGILYKGSIDKDQNSSILFTSLREKGVKQLVNYDNASLYSPQVSADGKIVYISKLKFASTYTIISYNLLEKTSKILVEKAGSNSFSVSPDEKKILYISSDEKYDIISKDLETGKTMNLTQGKKYNYSPKWSPDGKLISFTSTREKRCEIYVMDIQGKNIKRLTNNMFIEKTPSWSPDGTKLIYSSFRLGDPFNGAQLYIIDINNLKEWQVTEAVRFESGYYSTDEAPYWGK